MPKDIDTLNQYKSHKNSGVQNKFFCNSWFKLYIESALKAVLQHKIPKEELSSFNIDISNFSDDDWSDTYKMFTELIKELKNNPNQSMIDQEVLEFASNIGEIYHRVRNNELNVHYKNDEQCIFIAADNDLANSEYIIKYNKFDNHNTNHILGTEFADSGQSQIDTIIKNCDYQYDDKLEQESSSKPKI